MEDLKVLPVVGGALGLALLAYVSYTVIYNLYFHPLAKYPGPLFHRIWRPPLLMDRVWGVSLEKIHRWHLKYGDYVRVAPDELSTISPGAWTDIYGYRRNEKGGFPKDYARFYRSEPSVANGERSVATSFDQQHSSQRRIFSHAFSDKALREQQPLLNRYANLMIEKMHDASAGGMEVDIVNFYNFITFDVIADLVGFTRSHCKVHTKHTEHRRSESLSTCWTIWTTTRGSATYSWASSTRQCSWHSTSTP